MTWHSPAMILRNFARLALLAFTAAFMGSCAQEPPTEANSQPPSIQTNQHQSSSSLEIEIGLRGQQPDREWLISLIPAGGGAFGNTPGDLTDDPTSLDLVGLTLGGTVTFEPPAGDYTFIAREVALDAPLQSEDHGALRDALIEILTLEGTFTAAAPQLEGENLSVLTDDNIVARVARFVATQVCLPKANGNGVVLQPASQATLIDSGVLDDGCLTVDETGNQKLKLTPETQDTKQVEVFCNDILSAGEAIGCSVYAMIKLADDFGDMGAPSQCASFDGEFDDGAHCGLLAAWGSADGPSDPVTLTLPLTTDPDFIEFETVIDLGNGLQLSASFATEITNSTDEISLTSSLLVCEVNDRSGEDAEDPDNAEQLGDVDPAGADLYFVEDGPIAEVNGLGNVVFDNDAGTDKEYFVRFNVDNGDGATGTLLMQFDAPGGGTLSMNVDFSIDLDDADNNGQVCDGSASGGAVSQGIDVLVFGSLDSGDALCTFVFTGIDSGITDGEYKVTVSKNGFVDQYPNSSKNVSSKQPIMLDLADGASCLNSPIFGDSRFGGIIGSRFGGIIG